MDPENLNIMDELHDLDAAVQDNESQSDASDPNSGEIRSPSTEDNVRMVKAARTSFKSIQHYDKVNACVFCGKLIKQKIKRHLSLKHTDEPRFKATMNIHDEVQKKAELYKMMCEGNDRYNRKILKDNLPGEIIVLKRPHRDTPASSFAPCHACRGYVLREDLWRHIRNCPCATEAERRHSNRLLSTLSSCNEADVDGEDISEFQTVVLAKMNCDEVKDVILRDPLLIKLGSDLLTNKGKSTNQVAAIRSKMRSMAKLMISVRSRVGQKLTLEDMLQPRFFDAVLASVREICGWELGDEQQPPRYRTPSLALKLGHGLKRAAEKQSVAR